MLDLERVTSSKRQPVHDEKAMEKKKRRKTQKSGGARGPHVEDDIDAESSGMSVKIVCVLIYIFLFWKFLILKQFGANI